jgi:hypothetical protein
MGRLDDDNINSCHDKAYFQDTFNELAEGDMDDRCEVIAKSMWEDYQHRLAARNIVYIPPILHKHDCYQSHNHLKSSVTNDIYFNQGI